MSDDKWIDINTEMPQENVDVLGYFKSLSCEVCVLLGGRFYGSDNLPVGKPTHWQHLPKRPTKIP